VSAASSLGEAAPIPPLAPPSGDDPPLAAARAAAVPSAALAVSPSGEWIWQRGAVEVEAFRAITPGRPMRHVHTRFVQRRPHGNATSGRSSRPRYVASLGAGLRVCAWPYTYCSNPAGEARTAARRSPLADCFVIDAEAACEPYAPAQQYVRACAPLGAAPIRSRSLTSPLRDYHPGFPTSVCLGPARPSQSFADY